MAVSESRGRWWFEISSYRRNRSRIQLQRNPWEGDGVPHPDSNTSRSGPTNPAPTPMLSPIIKRQWSRSQECQHHTMSEPCSLHVYFLALIYSPSTASLMREKPPRPPGGFYSKHMLPMFEVPTIPGFSSPFFKSNPQNLKYFKSYLSAICEDATLHAQV